MVDVKRQKHGSRDAKQVPPILKGLDRQCGNPGELGVLVGCLVLCLISTPQVHTLGSDEETILLEFPKRPKTPCNAGENSLVD